MDISRYLRIPFIPNGRSWYGCDCYGLIWLIYKFELDIELESYSGAYALRQDELLEHTLDQWTRVDNPQHLDGIMFIEGGELTHIGLYWQPGWMLHTCQARGLPCLERYNSYMWRSKLEGFYRCSLLDK